MKKNMIREVLAALSAAAFALEASAATITWDADPATTGAQNGSGVWTNGLPDTNWWNGAANTNWNNVTPDSAIIGVSGGAAAGIISVTGSVTVGGITFNPAGSGTYLVTGGQITPSGTAVFQMNTNAQIDSPLVGGATIQVQGPRTLTLNGTNTLSGTLSVTNSTAAISGQFTQLGNISLFGTQPGVLNVMPGASVRVTSSIMLGNNASSNNGTINQSGGLVDYQGGTNSFRIAHWPLENSFYNMSGGTLLCLTNRVMIVGWDGVGNFNLSGGTASVYAIQVGGGDSGTRTNIARMNLTGGRIEIGAGGMRSQTNNSAWNIGGGTIAASANSSSAVPLRLNATNGTTIFDVPTSLAMTLSGVLSGTGGINKIGAGSLQLTTSANSYSGGTIISNGTLSLGSAANENAAGLGSGNVTIRTGAQLMFAPGSSANTFNIPNTVTLDGGTIWADDGQQHLVNTLTVTTNGGELAVRWDTKSLYIDGLMTGTGPLQVSQKNNNSSGVHFANPSNTYSGTITVNGSNAKLDNNRALTNATINLVVANNGLQFNTGVTAPVIGALTGSGNDSIAGVTLTTGNNNSNTTYSGSLSGAGSLVKIGSGTFTLSGNSTHSGETAIRSGTLALGASGSITNSTITVDAGSTFDVTALVSSTYAMPALQTIQGAGTISGSVTSVGAPASKVLPGAGGVAGTLTISTDFTQDPAFTNYFDVTNSVTVGSGVNDLLVVENFFAPQNSAISINALAPLPNGTYRLINYGSAGAVSFGALLGATSRDTWTLDTGVATQVNLIVSAGTNQSLVWNPMTSDTWDIGTTTNWLNTGTVQPDAFYDVDNVTFDDSGAATNVVVISASVKPASVIVDSTSNYVFAGAGAIVNGFGQQSPLTKSGTGTLTILTTNTFSGGATISNGTLQLGDGGGLGTIGNGPVANAGALVFNNSDTVTLVNAISGAGTVTKIGAGQVALSSSNTFTGGLQILGGVLAISGSGVLGGGAYPTAITNDGVLAIGSSATQTLSGVISGTGLVLKSASGTLTIGGAAANTFTTPLIIYGAAGNVVNLAKPDAVGAMGSDLVFAASAGNAEIVWFSNEQIPDSATIDFSGTSHMHLELLGHTETVARISASNGFGVIENRQNQTGIETSGTFIVNGAADSIFNGYIRNANAGSGAGVLNLRKEGAGTLNLGGANITFTGNTVVNGGILLLSNATAFASSITNNATLEIKSTAANDAAPDWGYGKTLTGTGTVNKTGTGWFHINAGKVEMSGGQINVQGGIMSGNTGGSTWTGNTANLSVSAGAVFSPHGNAIFIGGLSGSGLVSNMGNAACTLTFGAANQGGAFNGNMGNNANALSLAKIGTGTQTLGGTNAHTGTTTVNAGTLALAAGATLGSSPRIITGAAGGTFDVSAVGTFGLASLQSLEGIGVVTGSIQATTGSKIIPGAVGTVGTLSFANSLFESALTTNYFDVLPGAAGDLVAVAGDLEPSNAMVAVRLTAPLTNGTYALFTYGGAKNSSFTTVPVTTLGSVSDVAGRRSFTIDETVANQVNLLVAGTNQILRWNPATSTNWDFAGINWQDTTTLTNTAFVQQDTVLFDDIGAASNGIVLVATAAPQDVTVNSTSNYSINGNGKITGYTGITKDGTGQFELGGTGNDYMGPVLVSNGIFKALSASALGATNGSTTILGNGALDVNGLNLGQEVVNIIGAGFGGNGTIINRGVQQINALQYVNLLGDASVGGNSNRWDVRSGTAAYVNLNGFTLTKVGSSYISFVAATVTNSGDILANAGTLSLETSSIVGGPGSIYVNPQGILQYYQPTTNMTKNTVLNGGLMSCGAAGTVASPVLINTNSGINTGGGNLTLINTISGPAGFVKTNGNTLILTGSNTYEGVTTIVGGTLQIGTNSANGNLGTNAVVNNAALTFMRPDAIYVANQITGSGSMSHASTGTVVLTGPVALTGLVSQTAAGRLIFDGNTFISSAATNTRSFNAQGNATLIITNEAQLLLNGTLALGTASASPAHIVQHSGLLNIKGAESASNYRALQIGEYPAQTSTYTMYGGSLYVTNGLTFLPWNATNGLLNIYAGTVVVQRIANNAGGYGGIGYLNLPGGSLIVGPGGLNNFNGTSIFNFGGGIVGAYASWTSGLNMILTGTNGLTTFDSGANTIVLNGLLSGTGGLVKTGSGTLALTTAGANTYLEDTFVSGGTLQLNGTSLGGGTSKLASAWIRVSPGATLQLAQIAQLSWGAGTPSVWLNNGALTMTDGQYNYVKNVVMTNGSTWALGTGQLINGLTGANFGLSNVLTLASASSNTITTRGGAIAANTGITFDVARGSSSADLIVSAWMADYNGTTGTVTKTGDGILVLDGTNSYTGATTVSNGTLQVNGYISGPAVIAAVGTLGGTGIVKGIVTSDGTVSPGASAGTLNFEQSYTQAASGKLAIDIGGVTQGDTHDFLNITGSATLGGTLDVSLINGFTPAVGDIFIILQASTLGGTTFTITNLPPIGTNLWTVDYSLGNLVILSVTNPPPSGPAGYDLWAGAITNGLTNYNESATGDGYPNLLKYATGSNPTNADNLAQMNRTTTNGMFALKFNRNTNATDLTLIIEGAYASTNEATWNGIATNIHGSWGATANYSEDTTTDPAGVVVWDTATATNRFLRLRVTRP